MSGTPSWGRAEAAGPKGRRSGGGKQELARPGVREDRMEPGGRPGPGRPSPPPPGPGVLAVLGGWPSEVQPVQPEDQGLGARAASAPRSGQPRGPAVRRRASPPLAPAGVPGQGWVTRAAHSFRTRKLGILFKCVCLECSAFPFCWNLNRGRDREQFQIKKKSPCEGFPVADRGPRAQRRLSGRSEVFGHLLVSGVQSELLQRYSGRAH